MDTSRRVVDYRTAVEVANDIAAEGKLSLVITSGCFDILHAGHVSYLESCRELGDLLLIGVNADWAVKKLKGDRRPVNPLADRMRVLAALQCVTMVCPVDNTTVTGFIADVRAKYWVKGGDYTVQSLNQDEVRAAAAAGTSVVIKPMVAGVSTTSILSRL